MLCNVVQTMERVFLWVRINLIHLITSNIFQDRPNLPVINVEVSFPKMDQSQLFMFSHNNKNINSLFIVKPKEVT